MLKSAKPIDVESPRQLELKLGKSVADAERLELAHKFRYISQQYNARLDKRLRYENVKYVSFYRSHSKAFDKLHFILRKYGIDENRFLKFAINEYMVCIPEPMVNSGVFMQYANHVYKMEKYCKIHERYLLDALNVARGCLDAGVTPARYISSLIARNAIAYEYISGRISKYFIATLGNFRKIFGTLDGLNRAELGIIYNAADELRNMVIESFIASGGKFVGPIYEVESAIKKLKETNNTTVNQTTKQPTGDI